MSKENVIKSVKNHNVYVLNIDVNKVYISDYMNLSNDFTYL